MPTSTTRFTRISESEVWKSEEESTLSLSLYKFCSCCTRRCDAFILRFHVNVNGALSECWRPEDAEPRVDQEGSDVSKYGGKVAAKERIHGGRKRKSGRDKEGAGREYRAGREGIGECFLHVGLLLIGNV